MASKLLLGSLTIFYFSYSAVEAFTVSKDGVVGKAAILTGPAHIGVPAACFQRVDPGPCGRDIVRVFYDHKTYTCKAFSYSGCGGNMNRFVSVKNCYKLCHPYYRQRPADIVDAGTTTEGETTTGYEDATTEGEETTTAAESSSNGAMPMFAQPGPPPEVEFVHHIMQNQPQAGYVPMGVMPMGMMPAQQGVRYSRPVFQGYGGGYGGGYGNVYGGGNSYFRGNGGANGGYLVNGKKK